MNSFVFLIIHDHDLSSLNIFMVLAVQNMLLYLVIKRSQFASKQSISEAII